VQETTRIAAGLLSETDPLALAGAPALLSPFMFLSGDRRAEPIPAGAYPAAFRSAVEGLGVRLREEPADRVPVWRGTVALAWIRPDGARATVEVPATIAHADAR
jgi:hypothetical protein